MSNELPKEGYLRLSQIIGNKKANPPIPPIYPISKSTWWSRCAAGTLPQPIKLSPRITVWRVEDIRKLIDGASSCEKAISVKLERVHKNVELISPAISLRSSDINDLCARLEEGGK